ncbi:hypothetical protein [Sphingomonas fuzhouensis]|uniref:hypothetical protein n=1 Tax=Sphingomonas fuzhouensis TaxID=3106033 RepID=UPI002AFEDB94|nr:hypothetical protein [Sphingomonas sp. SGZ-02]
MSMIAMFRHQLACLRANARALFADGDGSTGMVCPGDPSAWGIAIDAARRAEADETEHATRW